MIRSEYKVEHGNFESWTNCVEDLRMKFSEFKDYRSPARHFQARLFPRPFLTRPEGSGVQTTSCLAVQSQVIVKLKS